MFYHFNLILHHLQGHVFPPIFMGPRKRICGVQRRTDVLYPLRNSRINYQLVALIYELTNQKRIPTISRYEREAPTLIIAENEEPTMSQAFLETKEPAQDLKDFKKHYMKDLRFLNFHARSARWRQL